jgi:ATP-dependent RNA helicase DeaD
MLSFNELELKPAVLKAIADIGYETPSPIQAQTIPSLLEGKDVLGQAQTGTGKTAAFALPILSNLDLSQSDPQAIVLVPTRELAIQVAESFQQYSKYLEDFHVLPIYGGADIRQQLRALKRGVHVVVGTPGRVMDHLERKSLVLDSIKTIVLDEADEMLKMGFIDDVEWILKHTPKNCPRALFSATMPRSIQNIADRYLTNPIHVTIKQETKRVSNISKAYSVVSKHHKLQALADFLEIEETNAVIIFTRTKTASTEVADKLLARGFCAAAINGDMKQEARERVIERMKSGALDIIVATEVAARGLDIDRISLVVNYDIPYDVESFIHRIGRTGRAGRTGASLLFIEPKERRLLKTFERSLREDFEEVFPPSQKEIRKKRTEKFSREIQEVLAQQDLSTQKETIQSILNQFEENDQDIAAAVLYLLQKATSTDQEIVDYTIRDSRDRGDRRERGERGDRGNRRGSSSDAHKGTYKMQIGKAHDITAKDIVGAFTNEAGIAYDDIGKISIFKNYTVIELPQDIPLAQWKKLEKLRIKKQFIDIDKGA